MSLFKKILLVNAGLGIFAFGFLLGTYVPNVNESNPPEQSVPTHYKSLPDYTKETMDWENHTIADFPELSFQLPNNWQAISFWDPMPSNAYGVESPDLKTNSGFQGITKGSILTFSISRANNDLTLEQIAISHSEGTLIELDYYLVANIPSVKFKHYCCESGNTQEVLLFIKNGYLFEIQQSYEKYSNNPHPLLVDKVGSTVVFKN